MIDGFAEPGSEQGIASIIEHPHIRGIYTWSRGGGWYGPKVTRENELWCDLNAFVIAGLAKDPSRSEEDLFHEYATGILGLSGENEAVLRDIALMSLDAVVKGKCCAAWDREPSNRQTYPTNQWMRDDVLHGEDKLADVFDFLIRTEQTGEALAEKAASVALWQQMRERCGDFDASAPEQIRSVVVTSVEYGLRLFSAITAAWEVLLESRMHPDSGAIPEKVEAFRDAWAHYEKLPEEYPASASLYRPVGWCWPGDATPPGLLNSVESLLVPKR